MSTKTIAITIGDPAGIGPEITLEAAQAIGDRLHSAGVQLLVVGDSKTLAKTGSKLG